MNHFLVKDFATVIAGSLIIIIFRPFFAFIRGIDLFLLLECRTDVAVYNSSIIINNIIYTLFVSSG